VKAAGKEHTMDISIKNQPIALENYLNPVAGKPKAGAVEEPLREQPGVQADTVNISESARQVRDAQQAARALPDVREEKVAEIRKLIADGRYEIKPDEIAEKMLTEGLMNDLLG
jgi:negative regulator of flagellin synthesis FlgM